MASFRKVCSRTRQEATEGFVSSESQQSDDVELEKYAYLEVVIWVQSICAFFVFKGSCRIEPRLLAQRGLVISRQRVQIRRDSFSLHSVHEDQDEVGRRRGNRSRCRWSADGWLFRGKEGDVHQGFDREESRQEEVVQDRGCQSSKARCGSSPVPALLDLTERN